MLDNTGDLAKEGSVKEVVDLATDLHEDTTTIKFKIDELSTTFDAIYAQQLESIIG